MQSRVRRPYKMQLNIPQVIFSSGLKNTNKKMEGDLLWFFFFSYGISADPFKKQSRIFLNINLIQSNQLSNIFDDRTDLTYESNKNLNPIIQIDFY